ncbi:hypothetical protein C2869_03340 [Saccharobesus litoralis]|uniref:Right-handed parallel beta-helix repeat-containing protein n=1 Tax=Saccharobesus litoralis TaxID=2172099 RepID=A0A2S0VMV3_9ALTE|nr:hypothetical protein [Saccharobesus litoralis]AWB65526.1 hypothetical protein C2869_03340 [Saccharobesus litoralis]
MTSQLKLNRAKVYRYILSCAALSLLLTTACTSTGAAKGDGNKQNQILSNKVKVANTNSDIPTVAEQLYASNKPLWSTGTDTDLSANTGQYVGYFENKVFDDSPTELFATELFNAEVNDTKRLIQALQQASKEQNGGVVRLRVAPNGNNNRFSLAHVPVPSNVRLEIEPEVVLEMRGIKENSHPTGKAGYRPNKAFLFSFGRSMNTNKLIKQRVKNVEIRSTDPARNFTVDARTNMPLNYGKMNGGFGNGKVNITRAIPFGYYFVENFAVSNVTILDNHTESVSVQLTSDRDYKDGAYAYRFGKKPVYLQARYQPNPKSVITKQGETPVISKNKPMNSANVALATNDQGQFVDDVGNVIPDMFAIVRNPTYGRTPIKGSIKNVKAHTVHTGYGTVQVYGGDWVEIENIESFNGIAVRLEAGNGTNKDNNNRAGPYYSSMNNISIKNVKVTNGFTGIWLKAHSKIMKNIHVENIEAIDSGTALLIGKGSFACKTRCRDLTRGRINNLTITGDIILRQTVFDKPVAEVGNLATYFLSQANRQYLAKRTGKNLQTISRNDLQRNRSGQRWYLIFPTAPVLVLSQLSATEIGDQSAKVGFFPVDLSQANIVQDGLALAAGETQRPNVLYRGDMRMPNGKVAKDMIDK